MGLVLLCARLALRLSQLTDPAATTREVRALVEKDEVDEAFELLALKENPYVRTLHRTLREALRRKAEPLRERVAAAFDAEHARQEELVAARRVRDFVVLALLGGAAVFAGVSERVASPWFLVACVACALLVAMSMALSRSALRSARNARSGALDVAMALGEREALVADGSARGSWGGECPACGARDVEAVEAPESDVALGTLGDGRAVRSLAVCRACGVGTFRTEPSSPAPRDRA